MVSWLRKCSNMRQIRAAHTIIVFVFVVMVLLLFAISGLFIEQNLIQYKSKRCSNVLAPIFDVVLDAGSTGTRVYVYRFDNKYGNELRLRQENVKRVQPGLSSYQNNPSKASSSLRDLTEYALNQIPGRYQRCTSITLKATAGLRLLPSVAQNSLLHEADQALSLTPFYNRGSSIISGREEGVYGWLTVNYLLHRLPGSHATSASAWHASSKAQQQNTIVIEDTVVTVDMGGGSTQIVFAVKEDAVGKWLPVGYTSQLQWRQQRLTLYQHSYLGLGLNEARRTLYKSFTSSNNHFPCLPHPHSIQFQDDNNNRNITLSNDGEQSFHECVKLFDTHVLHVSQKCSFVSCGARGIPQPNLTLSKQAVYVFSYFYDMIYEIAPDKNDITVQTFEQVANDVCHSTNSKYASVNTGTTCMDLSYLYAFLHHGLGLPKSKKLYVHHTIDDRAVTWSLGASIAWLMDVIL